MKKKSWKGRLPQHDPHPNLWNRILAGVGEDQRLSELARQLPSYEPPAQNWEGIEKRLRRRNSLRRLRQPAAAAGILLLAALWPWREQESGPQVSMTYEEVEIEVQAETEADADEEQRALARIEAQCRQYAWLCEDPRVVELKAELQDLEMQKDRLEQMMHPYDTDPELKKMMVRLERERDDLLKQMVSLMQV